MKILVAGATGVIGRLLLPQLLHAGHELTGMTSSRERGFMIEQLGARAVVADALDRERVMEAVATVKPDAIIHQLTSLSQWNLEDNARIRRDGTRNLVDAALASGVPLMIAQSISWAYEPGDSPASESVPLDIGAPDPRGMTVDGVSALEQAVSEMPRHVILRYGMLYGPGTWYDRGGIMEKRILHKEVPATEAVTSFLHVEDAANAAALALDWPSGIYNIVDDVPAKGTDWLPAYADALGAPMPELREGKAPWERGAFNAKARGQLGWVPRYPTWREGFGLSLGRSNDIDE
ncbi:NAD-dependent epimerase/dehydratase family protein [Paenibacillus ihbetae]|uniref:dTDP-glucose 4,6-dehydratase n=1 Tax=Paenibacillus ihbetae TaxID=1870820 RepID=A0ABX3JXS8_9BACL|nr:NAD(P)-dependent oxidoreductase [Paenibacillus ihbetae]OOC62481.1 dTDP-glucose 4,6-dehydratase [Paenibacillus ihbetae]